MYTPILLVYENLRLEQKSFDLVFTIELIVKINMKLRNGEYVYLNKFRNYFIIKNILIYLSSNVISCILDTTVRGLLSLIHPLDIIIMVFLTGNP